MDHWRDSCASDRSVDLHYRVVDRSSGLRCLPGKFLPSPRSLSSTWQRLGSAICSTMSTLSTTCLITRSNLLISTVGARGPLFRWEILGGLFVESDFKVKRLQAKDCNIGHKFEDRTCIHAFGHCPVVVTLSLLLHLFWQRNSWHR